MRMKENSSSTVSHELSTPLSSVLFFIQTLMQMLAKIIAEDPAIEKYFKLIVMQLTV